MVDEARPAVLIDGHDHLSSTQVARYLGIKLESVYAYASRGILHRVRLPGRRESYFRLAEVEALIGPAAPTRRRSPGLSEDIRTGITLVEADRLSYRGVDACDLANRVGFAEVCALLWQQPADFVAPSQSVASARAALAGLSPTADVANRVRVVLAALAADDPSRNDRNPSAVVRMASRMIMTSAVALGPVSEHPAASVAGALAAALSTDQLGWLDAALVLLADHDLAGSTTAVRVAASARANPYAAVSAGLGAWDSPLHGTASRAAYRMLADLVADPEATTAALLQTDANPPGFGHVIYTDADPRAELLITRLHELADHPTLAAGEQLAEALWRHRGLPRTVDLALALAAHAFQTPPELGELVFVHARMAGWIAHVLEEYACPPLRFRLHGIYTGARP
jgi:citrate synthase